MPLSATLLVIILTWLGTSALSESTGLSVHRFHHGNALPHVCMDAASCPTGLEIRLQFMYSKVVGTLLILWRVRKCAVEVHDRQDDRVGQRAGPGLRKLSSDTNGG